VDRHTAKKGLKEKSALLPKALQKSPVVQRRGHEIKRDETFLPLSLPKTMGILKLGNMPIESNIPRWLMHGNDKIKALCLHSHIS